MTYSPETDTEKLIRISKLPPALALAEHLEHTMQWPIHGKAADELRRLHAEVEEQCRLNAMGQEREARLMAENEELRRTVKLIVDNVRRKDEAND